jgi:hypothetical protein
MKYKKNRKARDYSGYWQQQQQYGGLIVIFILMKNSYNLTKPR